MKKIAVLIVAVFGAALLAPMLAADRSEPANPLAALDRAWADDRVWYDGQAEIATYQATRTIYGQPRSFTAIIMTNKEHASAKTKTKSATGDGRAVFKHHLREDVPTQKYAYHHSVMAYVGVDDFKSLKLDMGSSEDCGATFKQYINHATPGQPSELSWHQFSYFPEQGHATGKAVAPADLVFHNALTLVLRGFPADPAAGQDALSFSLLPDQISNKWSPTEPDAVAVTYAGQDELDLPYGKLKAHHVVVVPAGGGADQRIDLWFAADPELRRVMVQYQGPGGVSYRLKTLTRDAYWIN